MAALGVGMMICTLWLPNKQETHASASESGSGQDEDADDGFAVAASEL
jgi:hypothetical protein